MGLTSKDKRRRSQGRRRQGWAAPPGLQRAHPDEAGGADSELVLVP